MKGHLFLLVLLFSAFSAFGQGKDIRGDRGIFNQTVFIRDRYVDTVLNSIPTIPSIMNRGRSILTAKATYDLSFLMTQNVMAVYVIGGQSNARGVGDSALSPNPSPGTVYQYYQGVFSEVTNEVGNLPGTRGSMWPSFGINHYRLTGTKICFVQTAKDGTGQMQQSDQGNGDWGSTDTLFTYAMAQANAAIAAANAAGYIAVFGGFFWCQGENDARYINDLTITKQNYKDSLTFMISRYRTYFGANAPFYIWQTGKDINHSDVGYSAVRAAQQEVCDENPLRNKMVSTNGFDFIARGLMSDDVHWNQAALNEQGTVGAEMVVNGLDLQWRRSGTSISYMPGSVGIGIKLPASPLHIYRKGVGAFITSNDSLNTAFRLDIENKHDGSFASSAIWYRTHLGLRSQIGHSAASSITGNDIMFMNSTPGIALCSDNGDINLSTGTSPTFLVAKSKLRIKNNGQISIGPNVDPHASTIVDIVSTTRGLRIPTMTAAQMNAISSPATGLLVYNTDSLSICHYNGTAWLMLGGAGGSEINTKWSLAGNSVSGDYTTGDFLGTTNDRSLQFKTNGILGAILDSVQRLVLMGRLLVNNPTDDANYAVIIKAVNNSATNGVLKGISNNGTAEFGLGYGGGRWSIGADLGATSGDMLISTTGSTLTVKANNTSTLSSTAGFSIGHTNTPTAFGDFQASTSTLAAIRVPNGTPPSSPVEGHIWQSSNVLQFRSNDGSTYRLNDPSGTWTPTITNGANVASTANATGHYKRNQNEVSFTVYVQVTPTASSAACIFDFSLPIASGFTIQMDAICTGSVMFAGSNETAQGYANATDDRITVSTSNVASTSARDVVITGALYN